MNSTLQEQPNNDWIISNQPKGVLFLELPTIFDSKWDEGPQPKQNTSFCQFSLRPQTKMVPQTRKNQSHRIQLQTSTDYRP